ncbi:MAG TPA: hypothetical protein VFA11_02710 [Acidimicrobiales bacterium]|nr:hypothetical protein [Acidimicrobiales bacterium]
MARDTTARQRIVSYLANHGPLEDSSGRAASALKDAVGYPGSQLGFSQLLAAMERDGQIGREIKGKRTYRVWTDTDASAVVPFSAIPVAPALHGAGRRDDDDSDDGIDYDELAQTLLRQAARAVLLERDGAASASAASQRRIRRLEVQVTELERDLARTRAERDKVAEERDELRRQLDAAVNNVEVLTERLGSAGDRRRDRTRDRLDAEERAILDELTRRPPAFGQSA